MESVPSVPVRFSFRRLQLFSESFVNTPRAFLRITFICHNRPVKLKATARSQLRRLAMLGGLIPPAGSLGVRRMARCSLLRRAPPLQYSTTPSLPSVRFCPLPRSRPPRSPVQVNPTKSNRIHPSPCGSNPKLPATPELPGEGRRSRTPLDQHPLHSSTPALQFSPSRSIHFNPSQSKSFKAVQGRSSLHAYAHRSPRLVPTVPADSVEIESWSESEPITPFQHSNTPFCLDSPGETMEAVELQTNEQNDSEQGATGL